jgi:DNA-binding LacI/PurR family transcriptional regulator
LQQSGYVRTDGRQGTVVSDAWQSSSNHSGVAGPNANLRPLRIGMVATRHVDDPAWTRPLHLVLERLLTATVFQTGGTLHQFVWTAPSSAESLVEEIVKTPLDGLVLPSDPIQGAPDLPGRLRDAGVFCVGFSGGAQGWTCDIDSVKVDDEWAFREITQRLIAMGHRRIAFVGLSLNAPYTAAWTRARLEAWRGVMAKAGLSCGEEDVFLSQAAADDPNNMASEPEGGWPKGIELVRQETYGCAAALRFDPKRHTAAVCANDHAAIGFIKGLRVRGIRVPEDVSVTGYDNHPEDFVRRELTTFALPEQKIVDSFLRIVAGRVSGEKPKDVRTTETLRPILVSRSSWAKRLEI